MTNKGSSAGVINRMKNKDKFFKIKEDKLIHRINKDIRDETIEELKLVYEIIGKSEWIKSIINNSDNSSELNIDMSINVMDFIECRNAEIEDKLTPEDSFTLYLNMADCLKEFEDLEAKYSTLFDVHNEVPKILINNLHVNDNGVIMFEVQEQVSPWIIDEINHKYEDEIYKLYGLVA